jgi:hypothetical protein
MLWKAFNNFLLKGQSHKKMHEIMTWDGSFIQRTAYFHVQLLYADAETT